MGLAPVLDKIGPYEEKSKGIDVKAGYLFGLIWGTLLGGIFLALLSLISEVPGQKPPQASTDTLQIASNSGFDDTQNIEAVNEAIPDVSASAPNKRPNESADRPQNSVLSADVTSSGVRPSPTIEASPFEGLVAPNLEDDLGGLVLPEDPVQIGNPTALLPTGDGAEQNTITPDTPSLNPLLVYRVPAQLDPEKSILSVVILDDPASELGPVDLAALGMAVTVAIDPNAADAATRMRAYRDAGFEVIAAPRLPIRAVTDDVQTALSSGLAVVTEAVAVLDTTGTGFEEDRRVIDAVNASLKASGHGLLTFDQGLGVALQTAKLEKIPTAAVDWDLDPKNQSASIVRRFMDQAAADAKRNGTAVVMGRLREETLTALTQWSEGRRAKALNIVPVSVVLLP
ncbi:MAG: divergent polysaccharide deacetylase family protein [Planktomarina sp.]